MRSPSEQTATEAGLADDSIASIFIFFAYVTFYIYPHGVGRHFAPAYVCPFHNAYPVAEEKLLIAQVFQLNRRPQPEYVIVI